MPGPGRQYSACIAIVEQRRRRRTALPHTDITKLTETVPFIIFLFHSIKMLLLSAHVEIFYGTETEAKSLENVQKCFCQQYILPIVGTVCWGTWHHSNPSSPNPWKVTAESGVAQHLRPSPYPAVYTSSGTYTTNMKNRMHTALKCKYY